MLPLQVCICFSEDCILRYSLPLHSDRSHLFYWYDMIMHFIEISNRHILVVVFYGCWVFSRTGCVALRWWRALSWRYIIVAYCCLFTRMFMWLEQSCAVLCGSTFCIFSFQTGSYLFWDQFIDESSCELLLQSYIYCNNSSGVFGKKGEGAHRPRHMICLRITFTDMHFLYRKWC